MWLKYTPYSQEFVWRARSWPEGQGGEEEEEQGAEDEEGQPTRETRDPEEGMRTETKQSFSPKARRKEKEPDTPKSEKKTEEPVRTSPYITAGQNPAARRTVSRGR